MSKGGPFILHLGPLCVENVLYSIFGAAFTPEDQRALPEASAKQS